MENFLVGFDSSANEDDQLTIFRDVVPPPLHPTPEQHNNNNNNNIVPQAPAPAAVPEGPGAFFQSVWRGQSTFFLKFYNSTF